MNDIVETYDRSEVQHRQALQDIGPKRSLSEILCPQTVSDLTLQRPIIDRLRKMIETKAVMNMVFLWKSRYRKDIGDTPIRGLR
jgi:hypothetical protein